jgi:hypothetical protein
VAGDDHFNTLRSNLRQALVGSGRTLRRMRRSLLEGVALAVPAIPPEMRDALAKLGRLNRDATASDDSAASPAPIVEPVRATAAADAPAADPATHNLVADDYSLGAPSFAAPAVAPAGLGWQVDRVLRVLPTCYPDGKPPRHLPIKTVHGKVLDALKAERESGQAPKNEKDLLDPSPDSVDRAVNRLGRANT